MSSLSPLSLKNKKTHISLKNVTKRYGSRTVLNVGDLNIHSGDAISIYGQNGDGKSTLVRILAGSITISKGEIWRSKEIKKCNLVYIPQNGGLYRNMTVAENFQIWAHLYNLNPSKNLSEKWYIKELGIDTFLNQRVKDLSGGFFKIVSIACGFSVHPDALILDEPFSNVDEEKKEMLTGGIEQLNKTLAFLILTNHKPTHKTYINKQVHLVNGQIIND